MNKNIPESSKKQDPEIIDPTEFLHSAFTNARRDGSLKEAVIRHAAANGITNIDMLFPEAHNLSKEPLFLDQDTEWAQEILQNVTKSPFPKVKQLFAEDVTRARGYKKGDEKIEEYITVSNRSVYPTTIYKKTSMDRDDILDIADFTTAAFIRHQLKVKLDEEIARCILVGDGRIESDPYKVDEACIIPVATDSDIMNSKVECEKTIVEDPDAFMDSVVASRKLYKGSGTPALFISEDSLSAMLLLKDTTGRRMYENMNALCTALRVSKIITIGDIFEAQTDADDEIQAIMVNMRDYSIGNANAGKTTMFDDFDIDYNQQKYLVESRLSGALTKPGSAITFRAPVATP